MNTMFTLMRKDWRTYRAPVIGTVVMGLGPYVIYALYALAIIIRGDGALGHNDGFEMTTEASAISLICVAVIAGAFGGMAWAAERADRSATFVALLPPTRLQQAASKLAVAGAWLLICFGIDLCVGVAMTNLVNTGTPGNYMRHLPDSFMTLAAHVAAYATVVFGVAWACSALLNSSAISASIGVVAGVVVVVLVGAAPPEKREAIWLVSSLSLGALAFLTGSAYQLVRVEP